MMESTIDERIDRSRLGDRSGFTLVEVIVALVILGAGVLAISASAGSLATATTTASQDAVALQAVNDRLSIVLMDPGYEALDSLYSGTETGVQGLSASSTRTTSIDRVRDQTPDGDWIDYTRVAVSVDGPRLGNPVTREGVVAAP